MKVFCGILALLFGCSASALEDEPMNLTRAQISDLQTTSNALGSFSGDRLPNIQQDNLEPGEYTVQFQIIEPPIDGLGFATYAYIVWKIEGQQISRIVSVFNGSAISGVADSVHVQLQDQSGRGSLTLQGTFSVTNGSPIFTSNTAQVIKNGQLIQFSSQPGIFYVIPNGMNGTTGVLNTVYTGTTNNRATAFTLSKYKVAVGLSKGTRATTMQPAVLQTLPIQSVNPGINIVPFPINDAGVISALITVKPNGSAVPSEASVVMYDAAGNALGKFMPYIFPTWYPIPPGTVNVGLENSNAGTDSIDFSVQWGIEG